MEKDIVESLRGPRYCPCECGLLDRAADEIERLRALVAELEDELKDRIIEEDLRTY